MRAASVAVILLAASCGRIGFDPVLDEDPGVQSGQRLKLVWDVLADGTRQVARAFDTERGELCSIGPRNGSSYCVPDSTFVVFSDAACTQQVALAPQATCSLQAYATTGTFSGTGPFRLFRLGPPISQTVYYVSLAGQCAGPLNAEEFDLHQLGTEVPMTELAELATVEPPTTSRLVERAYTMPDGFRMRAGVYDRDLAMACAPGVLDQGQGCIPELVAAANYAADPACLQRWVATTPEYPKPYGKRTGACLSDVRYYAVGAAAPHPLPVYIHSALTGTCVVISGPPATHTMYPVVGEVFPAELARTIETRPARLRHVEYTAGGFDHRDPQLLFDTALGETCRMQLAADGVRRCLPGEGMSVLPRYRDSQCTDPISIGVMAVGLGCAMPPQLPRHVLRTVRSEDWCLVTTAVDEVIGAYSRPVYEGDTTSCALMPPDSAAVIVELGSEFPPSRFVASEQITDP